MLWYYDISRREFLRVAGLSAAGLALYGPSPAKAERSKTRKSASSGTLPARIAVAGALHDAGAKVVTCVPSSGTAGIFDAYTRDASNNPPYSYNEEVAYTLAHSAGLTGSRSATIIKAHGFAKASNSVVDSLSAGTTAGFVSIVTYDAAGRHSDNIFDYAELVKGSGIPFKISRPEAVYRNVLDCFRWSEELKLPVALLVDSNRLETEAQTEPGSLPARSEDYKRDPYQHVLCPPLAKYQYQVLQAKLSGERRGEIKRPSQLIIPDSLPQKWQKMTRPYTPLFRALKNTRSGGDFVAGDTSVTSMFAFAPYDCIDVTTYYGGSLPLALGAYLSGRRPAWAVVGDYAFLAAGHMGLIEASSRKLPLKIVVMHNGCAQTTGGQPVSESAFRQILNGYKEYTTHIDFSVNHGVLQTILKKASASDKMEIIVLDYTSLKTL